jgi:hypothetical protein
LLLGRRLSVRLLLRGLAVWIRLTVPLLLLRDLPLLGLRLRVSRLSGIRRSSTRRIAGRLVHVLPPMSIVA